MFIKIQNSREKMSFYLRHQFVLIIIFASIAVLFPKYFYPMLMNQDSPTPKDQRYVGEYTFTIIIIC